MNHVCNFLFHLFKILVYDGKTMINISSTFLVFETNPSFYFFNLLSSKCYSHFHYTFQMILIHLNSESHVKMFYPCMFNAILGSNILPKTLLGQGCIKKIIFIHTRKHSTLSRINSQVRIWMNLKS